MENSNKFENEITIVGHEIKVFMSTELENVPDGIVDNINQSILDGNDSGFGTTNDGIHFEWEKVSEENVNTYIEEKIKKLEEDDEVWFEHNQLIYHAYLRSDEEYEIELFDMSNFTNGEELEAKDSMFFDGSAKATILEAIETLV